MKLALHTLIGLSLVLLLATPAVSQNQRWVRQFGGAGFRTFGSGVAPDGSGGAYLCGSVEGSLFGPHAGEWDTWLARYDAAGNLLWGRQFGSAEWDIAEGVAPDGSGGTYACGWTAGNVGGQSAGGSSAWLARYDSSGTRLWIRQFGGVYGDLCTAVASDGAGGVFAAGITQNTFAGPFDLWVARYDGAGNQLWIQQAGSTASDDLESATPDGAGGVLLTATVAGATGLGSDIWVARYDSAGSQLWAQQLGTVANARSEDGASDGAGGVYVCGQSASFDALVMRYDGAGNLAWIRQFGGGSTIAFGASPDGAGGVFVGGATTSSLFGPIGGIEDAWLARYDSAGNQLWGRQFGSGSSDGGGPGAPDGSGGVFVTGSTGGNIASPSSGNRDAWLVRFDGDFDATRYCRPRTSNSTGAYSLMSVTGSNLVADNDITLRAYQLPSGAWGLFLTSQTQGRRWLVNEGGGTLCLDGAIGRYVGPGQLRNSGAGGSFELVLDLAMTPTPTGLVQVVAGETWNFQAWHRDSVGGQSTSNFTDAVSVTFE